MHASYDFFPINGKNVTELQKRVNGDSTSVIRWRRLRCYGHVQRAKSSIKYIVEFSIPGTGKQGRLSKTWSECTKTDGNNKCGVAVINTDA